MLKVATAIAAPILAAMVLGAMFGVRARPLILFPILVGGLAGRFMAPQWAILLAFGLLIAGAVILASSPVDDDTFRWTAQALVAWSLAVGVFVGLLVRAVATRPLAR